MPGPRIERIKAAFDKHIETRSLDQESAQRLKERFLKQLESGSSNEVKYFSSLSDEEFEKQIKLYEKCKTDVSGKFQKINISKSTENGSKTEAGIFKALFAPETDDKDIQKVSASQVIKAKYDEAQRKINEHKIDTHGLSDETVELANLGLMLKDSNIVKIYDIAKDLGLHINADYATNPVFSAGTTFFENMIGDSSLNRPNTQLVKFIMPDVREQCQDTINQYASGNNQPLADAIFNAFNVCYDRITDIHKGSSTYFFCIKTMGKCVKVLESPGMASMVNIDPKKLETYNVLVKEKASYDEISQLGEAMWEEISNHLFDDPNKNYSKPLNDTEFNTLYLRYAAMSYIRRMSKFEADKYNETKKLSGDLKYAHEQAAQRPILMFEKLNANQKETLINAVIEKVIKPSNTYQDLKEQDWLELSDSFESSTERYDITVRDFESEYPEIIKGLNSVKSEYKDNPNFEDVIKSIDKMLELDKELNKNGKPKISELDGKLNDTFKDIEKGLTVIYQKYEKKVRNDENKGLQASSEDILIRDTTLNIAKGLKDPQKKIKESLDYAKHLNELTTELKKQGDALETLSVPEDGTTISSKDITCITLQERKALITTLNNSYKILIDNGLTRRDSKEFSEMMNTMKQSIETIKGTFIKNDIENAVDALIEKSENYYMAKVTQSHNRRRSVRFNEAMKLINLKNNPQKSEKELLLDALAMKVMKTDMTIKAKKNTDDADKAKEILGDKKSLKKMADKHRKSDAFKRTFHVKNNDELRKYIAESGEDVRGKVIATMLSTRLATPDFVDNYKPEQTQKLPS